MPDCKIVGAALVAAALLVSCAETEDDAVDPRITIIDQRTDALTSASINFITGTYSTCVARTGSWSLPVTGNPTLPNDLLTVAKNDTACTLTITDINVGGSGGTTVSASSPISLGTAYGTARSFGSPIDFYANAMLSSVLFDGPFTLTLLFSDDPRLATDTKTASYAVATATVSASSVPAPNYTLDLSGVVVTTDSGKVTESVTGNLALTPGANLGDDYVLVLGSVVDTYAAIKTAYDAGSKVAISTPIAASSLLANGVNLTSNAVRTVIIAKTLSGVSSYQKFTITFQPPP